MTDPPQATDESPNPTATSGSPAPESAARAPAASATAAGGRRWLWAIVLPMIVVLAAGVVRFHQLAVPERCYFDETYYYYDARDFLEFGTERSFAVHPPVGKWIIAGGVAAFGVADGSPVDAAVTVEPDGCVVGEDDPENPAARAREAEEAFARRVMSAIFGTGAVAIAYFAGLRLFRRRSAALLGAALLAFDGLALTMSRISMLDIFLQFFVLLGVLALLIDRDRLWADTPDHPPMDDEGTHTGVLPTRSRGWLWVAGVVFGLAVATKWSALAPLGLAWAWVLGSELWWRRRWTGAWTPGLGRAVVRGFIALALVPLAVYLVSYTGWFTNFEDTRKADRCAESCAGVGAVQEVLGGWWEEQGEIFRFHRDLEAEHPYRAPASTWMLMTRPVAYYYESCPADRESDDCEVEEEHIAHILGIGNPAMWWMALIGYPWLFYLALRRRRWAALTIALFLFGQALPYLLAPRPVFLFYLTPVVPFVALALAHLADEAMDSKAFRWVPAVITIVSLAGFAFWAPLFLGTEISSGLWRTLILFDTWI